MPEPQKRDPSYAAPKPAESAIAGVKDTIESILIAFILAFIFRAFVVEAFVIPTGSMAPTLLGANMRYHCDDCGWDFTVNYSGQNSGDDVIIPSSAGPVSYNIHCPNCGYKLPARGENGTFNTPIFYGDRILVLKYLYLFQEPRRWDVVVFKAPAEPELYHYTQNYIKRLIGKPGEQVVILDGDIYVRKSDSDPWVVQTKPYDVQQDLWRIIYDNDHHPRGLPRTDAPVWQQPWKTDADGWNLGTDETTGRVLRYNGTDHAATLTFDRDSNPEQHAFTDWMAYDSTAIQQYQHDPYNSQRIFGGGCGGDNFVSDLKLDLYYTRQSGDGAFRMELEKISRRFAAEFTPGSVKLVMHQGTGPDVAIGTAALPASAAPMHIEFTNVDYQVSVRVNGQVLIQTTPAQYAPDFDALLKVYESNQRLGAPAARISADHQVCAIEHLSLWRDIYYGNRDPNLHWAVPFRYPEQIMKLGKDEYFVLGDNSPISGDARYWTYPVDLPDEDLNVDSGRVPGRFMLGKAFFVYWPAGYRVTQNSPAVIPNFGQMRFIH
jgi:signal peptidase I